MPLKLSSPTFYMGNVVMTALHHHHSLDSVTVSVTALRISETAG
jgi:hypothetical protein